MAERLPLSGVCNRDDSNARHVVYFALASHNFIPRTSKSSVKSVSEIRKLNAFHSWKCENLANDSASEDSHCHVMKSI
jgi:hypothetical protein